MIAEHLLNQAAVVTDRVEQLDDAHEVVRDEFGNPLFVDTVRTVACWFEQNSTDEAFSITEQTLVGYFPPGDPISSTSTVTIDGVVFQVIGPPSRPVNPRTGEAGLVTATLKRTTG